MANCGGTNAIDAMEVVGGDDCGNSSNLNYDNIDENDNDTNN